MNEIKLSGYVYSKKVINEKLTTFAIKYYAGKDKNGNYINGFMNCKFFGILPQNDSEKVEVSGWLGYDTWEKDGKKQGRTVICCKEVDGAVASVDVVDTTSVDLGDEIPF